MARELNAEIVHDPSAQYTRWPGEHGQRPLDLTVTLHVCADDSVMILAFARDQRSPRTRVHRARLRTSASAIRAQADRLRHFWYENVVRLQLPGADRTPYGRYAFAETCDLRPYGDTVDPLVEELAVQGRRVLDRILAGTGSELEKFRDFLLGELREENLRVSFDSELYVPWPMLAVRAPGPDASSSFLGHRHQIEQTGAPYPLYEAPPTARAVPAASLNTDTALDGVGRSDAVYDLLREASELTVRTTAEELFKSLRAPDFDEDLMYFWCHGMFVERGSHRTVGIQLSDGKLIDAESVHRYREECGSAPGASFRPFVLINACHAGEPADTAELEYLGSAFIEHGADGVLGPQIEMPQVFAAEYAHAFIERYVSGAQTAGEICHALVKHFIEELRNPLALSYSLHCGIDSRWEKACTSPPSTSTNGGDSAHLAAAIPSQATASPSTSPDTSTFPTG
ncbi:CHAT domain-containing protein [Streptomyces sp. NPDC007063]|uniref:CHAT domain-containing protein n=1 Tax=Streptomyces sp. NPDC007063 TaxID=3364772 RepID=UPI00369B5921